MNKHLSSNKGFTLVEVIVVAVIVMVLAAVAIPLYQGYVRDARRSAAEGIAATVVNIAATGVQAGGNLVQVDFEDLQAIELQDSEFGSGARAAIPCGYTVTVADGLVTVAHDLLDEDVERRFADAGSPNVENLDVGPVITPCN